ncbi:alpha/beta hydrolase [Amycolatopsis benzoatilytica]|uniref:alpha/beta hydrolase n=1 Tax=Amycolatopsis benzoatilytica TaxID=346045 RepID=UPI000366C3DA|nr:alpha/beta hydrolase [Amycolatopsis benzoatilytica]
MTSTFVFAAGANGVSAAPAELVRHGYRGVGVPQPEQQFRLSYQAPQDLAAFAAEPSALAGVTVADQVAATVAVVRRAAQLGPVVLVGSSIGGALITLVAEEVPELVAALVYDAAFCCVGLATPDEYLATPEGTASQAIALAGFLAADPTVIGAMRFNWRSGSAAALAAAKEALCADATDGEFFGLLNAMAPDDLLGRGSTDSRGTASRWGRVPRHYVRHLRDHVVPLALQDRMIAEADDGTPENRFEVHDVDTSHFPDAAGMAQFVEVLDKIGRSVSE